MTQLAHLESIRRGADELILEEDLRRKLRGWRDEAITKAKAGDLAQALALCDEIVREAPADSIGPRTRADVYYSSGGKLDACQQLRSSIAQRMAPVADYCKLCFWLVGLGEFKEALGIAEDALARADVEERDYLGPSLAMVAAYSALRLGDTQRAASYAANCPIGSEEYFDGAGMVGREQILREANRLSLV